MCLPSSLHDVALNVERCATSFIEKKPFTSAKTIIVPGHSIRKQRHVLMCSETCQQNVWRSKSTILEKLTNCPNAWHFYRALIDLEISFSGKLLIKQLWNVITFHYVKINCSWINGYFTGNMLLGSCFLIQFAIINTYK